VSLVERRFVQTILPLSAARVAQAAGAVLPLFCRCSADGKKADHADDAAADDGGALEEEDRRSRKRTDARGRGPTLENEDKKEDGKDTVKKTTR